MVGCAAAGEGSGLLRAPAGTARAWSQGGELRQEERGEARALGAAAATQREARGARLWLWASTPGGGISL